MIHDYFADLELSCDATEEDIRKAYRRLAKRYHPDINTEDAFAKDSFRIIRAAYEYLSEESRAEKLRREISKLKFEVKTSTKAIEKWSEAHRITNVKHKIQNIEKQRLSAAKGRPAEELNVFIDLRVRELEIENEVEKTLEFEFHKPCSDCRGRGGKSRSLQTTCKVCIGLGYLKIHRGAYHWKKACETCSGKGFMVQSPCKRCEGRGKILDIERVNIRLSKKLAEAEGFWIRKKGNISFDGKTRGDLWVQMLRK